MNPTFDSIDDLLLHIERISRGNHHVLKRWTAAQNFYHLASAFEGSLNGLAASYPLPVRVLARRLRWVITRFRFPPWLPIPSAIRESLDPPASCDFDTEKTRLVLAIHDFQRYTGQHPSHPVLGQLTRSEWIGFHLRHCEHHLSFISLKPTPL